MSFLIFIIEISEIEKSNNFILENNNLNVNIDIEEKNNSQNKNTNDEKQSEDYDFFKQVPKNSFINAINYNNYFFGNSNPRDLKKEDFEVKMKNNLFTFNH